MTIKWNVLPKSNLDFSQIYNQASPVFQQLLFNRGLTSRAQIEEFLTGKLDKNLVHKIYNNSQYLFYDPFLFSDMEAVVNLIIKHIKEGSFIVVYGDYDADGVTSSIILKETLQIMHARIDAYLPDRVNEGYGLNKGAIDKLATANCKLIITVDCGIRNTEEIEYAKDKGIDVIVTDHHSLPENEAEVPACLIINPSDPRNQYPNKKLAGVGVAFKLISALLIKSTFNDKQKQKIIEQCLDLVAIGTVADMVSLLGENRLLVKHGLELINKQQRLGLQELLVISNLTNKKIDAWNIGWQISPRLNAASRLGHANTAFNLLTSTNYHEVKQLARELNQRNYDRQLITRNIIEQVEAQIDINNLPNIIISVAEGAEDWNEGVVGLVAGRIVEKYYRPTLIISKLDKDNYKGSGRSIPGLNLIELIEESAVILDKYGGHPMACGFSLSSEKNLLQFKKNMQRLIGIKLEGEKIEPSIEVEAELNIAAINLDLVQEINLLAPFGQDNKQPKLASRNLVIEDIVVMGAENQHIKIRIAGLWALAFGRAEKYQTLKIGDKIDLLYYLEQNNFNGRSEPQLKIIDLQVLR